MSQLFTSTSRPSKNSATFIVFLESITLGKLADELALHICSFLGAQGEDRTKMSLRHFFFAQPRRSYVKFTATLEEQDSYALHYIGLGGAGCLGFSNKLHDYAQYLSFSDVEVWNADRSTTVSQLCAHFGLQHLTQQIGSQVTSPLLQSLSTTTTTSSNKVNPDMVDATTVMPASA
eukprot:TRINITY_DN1492_c0_g1_i4.p1 TRINITY_DN1492_c0_g1~~TRINITY_DN1492_c0_g1_i4.p1  ORF type:complete len:176 (+),score=31.94 TRINITY_DN1492_c0_g1_i4:2-529(+)